MSPAEAGGAVHGANTGFGLRGSRPARLPGPAGPFGRIGTDEGSGQIPGWAE